MSKRNALKELSRRFPLVEEIEDFISGLEHKGDREAAIMGGSLLEACFERTLLKAFQDKDPDLYGRIFQNRGPLADLDSKILISQALGIISGAFAAEMHRIRAVRNAFAHSILDVNFEESAIKSLLEKSELATAFFSLLANLTHEDKELERLMRKQYANATGKMRYIFFIRCGCAILGF